MAQEQGNTTGNKERKPYFGERKIKTGNMAADKRKLTQMLRGAKRKDAK